jgi:hypothetical protein
LNAVPKLGIPEEYVDKWRTVMLERVRSDQALDVVMGTVRWFLNEVKRS